MQSSREIAPITGCQILKICEHSRSAIAVVWTNRCEEMTYVVTDATVCVARVRQVSASKEGRNITLVAREWITKSPFLTLVVYINCQALGSFEPKLLVQRAGIRHPLQIGFESKLVASLGSPPNQYLCSTKTFIPGICSNECEIYLKSSRIKPITMD